MICENADPDVRRDLETFMADLAPDGDARFVHTAEGPDDMPAHVRSVLTQTDLTIPITDGEARARHMAGRVLLGAPLARAPAARARDGAGLTPALWRCPAEWRAVIALGSASRPLRTWWSKERCGAGLLARHLNELREISARLAAPICCITMRSSRVQDVEHALDAGLTERAQAPRCTAGQCRPPSRRARAL